MAINKAVNSTTKSHGAMRNCIEYVLKEQKTIDKLVDMTGPGPDEITWDSVYKAFLDEKKLWDKDNGRMYAHNIISFHKEEKITPFQAFEFAKEFVAKWFGGFQTLISIHQDKDHVHVHMVTNTVSYIDGKKLHTSKADLQKMKDLTNQMCMDRGLHVPEKGKHFNGKEFEIGTTTTWSKDKYHLFEKNKAKSYVVDCLYAVMNAKQNSFSKDDFIKEMSDRGWNTTWVDNRKNITFINSQGQKVRASNLSKTFSIDISKESLINEFTGRFRDRDQCREDIRTKGTRGYIGMEAPSVIYESKAAIAIGKADRVYKESKRRRENLQRQREARIADFELQVDNKRSRKRERDIDIDL